MKNTVPAPSGELSIPPDVMEEIMTRLMQVDILLKITDDITDIRASSRILLNEAALLLAQVWIPETDMQTDKAGLFGGKTRSAESYPQ